jgi:hypothetical protein
MVSSEGFARQYPAGPRTLSIRPAFLPMKDLFQIGERDPLPVRDLLDRDRPFSVMPGDLKDRPHSVFSLRGQLHCLRSAPVPVRILKQDTFHP